MGNRPDENSDITKSQSAQQPNQKDRSEENRQTTQGGLDPGNAGQSGAETKPGSDAGSGPATDTGFVGAEGQTDTSSELVEDDDPDFAKDGQGSIE
jgi:hypothetical protein